MAGQLSALPEREPPPVFLREGLAWRFSPPGTPVILRFSRLVDTRDETTAEVHVVKTNGEHIFRRRVNLLGSRTQSDLVRELKDRSADLGIDWSSVVAEGCESVLNAHRAGAELETVEGVPQRPQPIRWLCRDLMIAGKPNCWLGAAGTGKSTLAKLLCVCHAAGIPFLGRETERGLPLYLDWEDDRETFDEIVYLAARGLGLARVPKMHYMRMQGRRLRDQVEILGQLIIERGITLLVIDAIAAAGGPPGEHSSYETIALEMEHALGSLPPVSVLGLDHVTGDDLKAGAVPLKGRGSIRKVEFFRNQWTLLLDREAADRGEHLIGWTNTKINRSKFASRFAVEIIHRESEIVVRPAGLDEMRSMLPSMRKIDRCIAVILGSPGVTVKEIAEALSEEKVPTVSDIESIRVTLRRESQHRDKARVYADKDGRWWPVGKLEVVPSQTLRLVKNETTDEFEDLPL